MKAVQMGPFARTTYQRLAVIQKRQLNRSVWRIAGGDLTGTANWGGGVFSFSLPGDIFVVIEDREEIVSIEHIIFP
jgi:hypothetical protein